MMSPSLARFVFPALAGTITATFLGLATFFSSDPVAAEQSQSFPPPGISYPQAVLAAHPVAYWRLGERPGAQTAVDATGHKINGQYHGKPHLGQPGALVHDKDTAVGLDGPKSKSYIQVPANKTLSVATSGKGLTVEVWLRPDVLEFAGENKDPQGRYIHWLGKGEKGAYEWGFRFYSKNSRRPNRISAYIWNREGGEGAGAYFEEDLPAHKWIHIVATFDDPKLPNARVRIYKDGEPSRNNSSPGALYHNYNIKPTTGSAPVRLATRDLRTFLTGGLDEVAIYPYVLSGEQIRRHWQLGSTWPHPL